MAAAQTQIQVMAKLDKAVQLTDGGPLVDKLILDMRVCNCGCQDSLSFYFFTVDEETVWSLEQAIYSFDILDKESVNEAARSKALTIADGCMPFDKIIMLSTAIKAFTMATEACSSLVEQTDD